MNEGIVADVILGSLGDLFSIKELGLMKLFQLLVHAITIAAFFYAAGYFSKRASLKISVGLALSRDLLDTFGHPDIRKRIFRKTLMKLLIKTRQLSFQSS